MSFLVFFFGIVVLKFGKILEENHTGDKSKKLRKFHKNVDVTSKKWI